ncbi:MAG: ATP-binding protein [Kiritimatiellia bacterium]|jgi:PAS domain S-box-containing protein|nr:ATP-binding protein [Kiritimatiellia bacterium]MDP6810651.1 ATP-binding protein [Kiritimatiellia bacterium]MDP7023737.1 ATP-binding protein [Kiritimatiellia bacterium]
MDKTPKNKNNSYSTMRIDMDAVLAGDRSVSESSMPTPLGQPRQPDGEQSDYAALLQSIYDGVVIASPNGRIAEYNARAMELLGCGSEYLDGSDVMKLISGADTALWEALRKNLEERRYTLIEARVIRCDGTSFPAEIAVNWMRSGETGMLCFLVRDISVRKQAQEALEDAVRRLEEHDQARMQFVSNVSHELRTPLTSMIYAVANMLRGVLGPISDPVRKYLTMLDGDSKRLLATVNDILDLRKIEIESLSLARATVPFGRLVSRSLESLAVRAQQKGVALQIDPGDKGLFADCDPRRMERVLLNIAGNAVKFTPEDGSISVSVERDTANQGGIRLAVRDTGIGIPRDALERVTERYFTVGNQPSGSGLGLAIVKEIVALHGGSIGIQSPLPGEESGTLVTVCLPGVAPPVILVAEANERISRKVGEQLTAAGYRVIRSAEDEDVGQLLEEHTFHGAVVGLGMEGMAGTELILKMKSDRELRNTPLIAVGGAGLNKARQQILKSFAIPLLPRDWTEAILLDCIEEAFLAPMATMK